MKRALCIWLPEWPIQRLVVAKLALDGKDRTPRANSQTAIVVHARDARRGQLVVACCDLARKLGMRAGMPLAEVSALQKHVSRSEPHRMAIGLHEHEPELDEEALSELAIWCEQFSPIVGLENCDQREQQPSSLLLDITGLATVFESESRLVELIQQAFTQRGYKIRIGIGDNVGEAWAIAHYAQTPDEHLNSLPIEALRLQPQTIDTLHQLGIETIDQLLQLPRDGLATRLGEHLIQRLDQITGKQIEVIIAHRSLPEFASEFLFEHPTYRRHVLETVLQQLTEDVTQLLAKHDHAAVQVEAELFGQRDSRKLFVSLFQPTSNPKHISDLLLLQLQSSQMREQVKRIRLTAVTSVRLAGQQHVLWDEVGHGVARRDSELAQLVDRLSSRLGKECVFGVQAQAGALPEKSYRKKLLTETMKSQSKRSTSRLQLHKQRTADTLRATHRPLWLHEPPHPLRLPSRALRQRLAGPDRSRSGQPPPVAFEFLNQHHEVAYHWGPERIETGWWSGKSVRRDYYRVETTEGCRFWLFRQLDDGAWFLHGCFE